MNTVTSLTVKKLPRNIFVFWARPPGRCIFACSDSRFQSARSAAWKREKLEASRVCHGRDHPARYLRLSLQRATCSDSSLLMKYAQWRKSALLPITADTPSKNCVADHDERSVFPLVALNRMCIAHCEGHRGSRVNPHIIDGSSFTFVARCEYAWIDKRFSESDSIYRRANGRSIGVAAVDHCAPANVSIIRSEERFPMCSTFKISRCSGGLKARR